MLLSRFPCFCRDFHAIVEISMLLSRFPCYCQDFHAFVKISMLLSRFPCFVKISMLLSRFPCFCRDFHARSSQTYCAFDNWIASSNIGIITKATVILIFKILSPKNWRKKWRVFVQYPTKFGS
jgi:hypothetical protein